MWGENSVKIRLGKSLPLFPLKVFVLLSRVFVLYFALQTSQVEGRISPINFFRCKLSYQHRYIKRLLSYRI